MPQKIQVRRGTAAEWTSANPILSDGEMGFEKDTKKIKFGDGVAAWSSLGYAVAQGGISYYLAGDITTGQNKVAFICPTALKIIKVIARVTTAPTGAALIVDIHKNGSTIFTTQDNRPAIGISETSVTSVEPDITALAEGDFVSLDVDQIGSTVAGANLAVLVEVQLA